MTKHRLILIRSFTTALMGIMMVLGVCAQDGHTHSHDEEGMESAHLLTGVFSVYAETKKYELTLKHEKIEPGKESDLILYIADYITNAPLNDVNLKIAVREDPSITIETEPHDAGVYHLHGKFPKAQPYSLVVNLDTKENGPDLMMLSSVEVGKEPPMPDIQAEEKHEHGESDWWKFALVFFGGLAIGYFFLRRRPKAVTAILVVIGLHALVQKGVAHGGHGDDEETTAGNQVFIPKETQFLFDILTLSATAGDFQPAVELFGTITPAPGEFAEITIPQSGKITSLNVTPGQKVNAGQTLATVRVYSSVSEQVGVATETGRLRADIRNAEAELNAAEKELTRLRSIADIAARKDVQAAEARYNLAKSNLDALRSIASGSASASMTLSSPVSGTVGPFAISSGTDILAGTTLFTVTSLDKVFVETQVFGQDAAVVRNAKSFRVTGSNEAHSSDKLKMISSALEVNPSNQSQRVTFELQNPDGEFKIGEFVTLQAFLQQSEKTIFVPNSALSEINGKPVVFVKDNPEMYAVRYLSLGEDNGTHTVVMKGMNEGERFVIAGTYQVKMMMLNQ
jgi:RND family efflux transporter MFP subunit